MERQVILDFKNRILFGLNETKELYLKKIDKMVKEIEMMDEEIVECYAIRDTAGTMEDLVTWCDYDLCYNDDKVIPGSFTGTNICEWSVLQQQLMEITYGNENPINMVFVKEIEAEKYEAEETEEGTVKITGYFGSKEEYLVVPETIGGKTVGAVDVAAIKKDNDNLIGIRLPETATAVTTEDDIIVRQSSVI